MAGRAGEGVAVGFYSNFGPAKGPLRYRDVPGSMGVLPARDDHMPIGQADCFGPDAEGRAVFRLMVGSRALEGRWLLVGREFVPAQEDGQAPERG